VAVIGEKENICMELVGRCVWGIWQLLWEKRNVYMELVGKCMLGMWQLLERREMYIWS
jgi:hypothetical protein